MNNRLLILVIFGLLAMLSACTKEVEIELPPVESKLVVEGSIEQGQPPIIIITRTQGYFEPTDLATLESIFVKGATVTITGGGNTVELDEICTSDLPEELLPLIEEATGLSVELLASLDICAYSTLNPLMVGQVNTVYDLVIEVEDEVLTSRTKINNLVQLDSVWFEPAADSLGFAWAILTDPDTAGNAYRWFAKRINRYPEWSENAGEQKDLTYIAPLGSSYDDEFFNGLSFKFAYYRGDLPNSTKEDDRNIERGFFKVGDTIAVRGCVIDRDAYNFFSTFEVQAGNSGSPLAVPANVRSNINGGLGVWVGYGAVYDTIICTL
ncbi:MAG: DUF4249 family protein [Flavobacteriales bacterium]|nr:DUF4249 family protein [Flavobacteriales bacterium]